jgi:succinyl-diaminopimelate desuccinylase
MDRGRVGIIDERWLQVASDLELAEAVDSKESELVEFCSTLVAAPSVSPPGDTRAVAEVVRAHLLDAGVACDLAIREPSKPSVLATIDGAGPGPHLVMNVHLDTMPAGDEAEWSVDPWSLTEQHGRLYGLGMGNMKGAVAAMTLAVELLNARAGSWPGRITFAAVSDEVMFGPDGAAWLLATRPDLYGDALICGEGPGWMRLAIGEKGVAWYELESDGPSGHSSRARAGESAVARLAAVVSQLDALTGRRIDPPLGLEALSGEPEDPGTLLSLNVGTFEGGTVVSQLPVRARANVDARMPPGIELDEIDALVRAACAQTDGIRWRRTKGWAPNWTDPSASIVGCLTDAATKVRGEPPRLAVRLPASDASRWRAKGTPAVCYGPQPTLSAGTDDFAERKDVVDCAKVYAMAAVQFLRSSLSEEPQPLE